MMKKFSGLLILLLLLLGACGSNDENNDMNQEDENKEQEEQTNEEAENSVDESEEDKENSGQSLDVEETKTVDMMIEGTTEEMVVNLHNHEELGFYTYVPEDMVVESDAETFNVYTNFQGNKNKDARLFMMKQSEEEIKGYLEGEDFAFSDVDENAYEFSNKEFHLEKEEFIGRVSLFTHNDENYVLGYYYPAAFADGFSPRSHIIVDEMEWHNN
ncbi:hypothetical protein E3U55_08770 [Filobacillus milosensis]|uniref:DUF4367 domain-containing protein n=1 Tax=Filobacillus milosensis TaxID=94137 RepID=A0A4Y8IP37_9BACI|nr:hypothetical protein [Filobacillus milosensis]TFB21397.1 hypothetical protein E3U55_08770 [Filobacillus milosensis]